MILPGIIRKLQNQNKCIVYNPKDINNAGRHDYDKAAASEWANSAAETFSIGIFKWVSKSNPAKGVKRSAVVLRVTGPTTERDEVLKAAEWAVGKLDEGTDFCRKSISFQQCGQVEKNYLTFNQ